MKMIEDLHEICTINYTQSLMYLTFPKPDDKVHDRIDKYSLHTEMDSWLIIIYSFVPPYLWRHQIFCDVKRWCSWSWKSIKSGFCTRQHGSSGYEATFSKWNIHQQYFVHLMKAFIYMVQQVLIKADVQDKNRLIPAHERVVMARGGYLMNFWRYARLGKKFRTLCTDNFAWKMYPLY